ncbi:hypothetical protein GRZ55_11675 [Chelativorans sp. ZYF759]|uniref:hypothetical protein n=1 Tax=Chelativorans sp. ZYF759 TaxID=2692213 RepID=UPI00145DEB93|nr:hypothetical protein [Chelativorans sp. ZYF759]NMG39903.1 hypothetical protein [Chelativorans sp. ZYF759]
MSKVTDTAIGREAQQDMLQVIDPARRGPVPDDDAWKMDWMNGEEIIVQEQRAIAVYRNRANGVVIRAERTWDEEEDVFVVLSSETAVRAVIAQLQRELEQVG